MSTRTRILVLLLLILAFAMFADLATAQSPGAQPAVQRPPLAQPAEPARETRLPVRRVVLYKNGIGYFEHVGRVRGSQDVTIDFTSGQLNDVLKSLTALDLGGGRVTGVNYNSDAPLSRRLGALRLPLDKDATPAQFWNALRGARLEVRAASGTFTGRLLSLETRVRTRGEQQIPTDELSLITDAGDFRVVELSPAVTVRVLERELASEVGRYLDLVGSTRAQDLRRMSISTAGTGERPLFVSYISEVPIWKTTYRLVLPSKPGAKPLLQGWAIVDNTVGEDWTNVELSLVAGAPQSFIQQLSQPYYSRRPVVPLPESAQLTPQTHQAAISSNTGSVVGDVTDSSGAAIPGAEVRLKDRATGSVVASADSDEDGEFELSDVPVGTYTLEALRPGFKKAERANLEVRAGQQNSQSVVLEVGEVASAVTVDAVNEFAFDKRNITGGLRSPAKIPRQIGSMMVAPPPLPAALPSAAMAAMSAAAQARELGDLFEYKLKEPVTIRKNQSAMAPIINTEIAAEKISLWNERMGTARPLRAVWLNNSSALTLDGGSFSVLDEETFAGEGLIEALKPGEKRILSYATDLGMIVSATAEGDQRPVRRVRIVRGVMTLFREERSSKTYTVRNEDSSPRTLIVEHPARPEWKVTPDTPAAVETAIGIHRFRVTAEPKKTTTLVVREVRPIESRVMVASATDQQIKLMVDAKTISPQLEESLRAVVAQKNVIAAIRTEMNTNQLEQQRIFTDQSRVRENMKALRGSAEEKQLLQRYTRQLDEQETRIDVLRKQAESLQASLTAEQAKLDKMIQEISFDEEIATPAK